MVKSGYGGNLTYPVIPHLLNKVNSEDIGMYTDTLSGARMLTFKKLGIQIPHNNMDYEVITPLPGEHKSVRLVVNPACPCEDCNFEYGIAVDRVIKKPGVNNSEFFPTGRYYGDKLFRIGTCVNGFLPVSDIEIIENSIMRQITNDVGGSSENSAPAIVGAKKYYIVNDTNNTNASGFTITWADRTTTVFVTATTFAAGQLGVQFNANTNVNTVLIAYRIGINQYLITSINDGVEFNLDTYVTVSQSERGLLLTAKSKDVKFNVKAEPGVFQIRDGVNLVRITPAAWTSGSVIVSLDGVTATATLATSQAASITAINNLFGGNRIFAIPNGANSVVIAALTTSKKMTVRMVGGNVDYNYSSLASFPFFTSDDVFVEFSQRRHLGKNTSLVYLDQPIKNAEYVKLNIFVTKEGHAAIHGASHGTDYLIAYSFYILRSEWDSTVSEFNNANFMLTPSDPGFVANRTLIQLFNTWHGQ